jgi:release factor glutamine methyltransferase
MTLREWLRKSEERLCAGPHPERARRDAETLLLHTLGKGKAWLMARPEERLDDGLKGICIELVERRFLGEPIQYITGETEFYGLPFRITSDVLIPRPETEHLVEKAVNLAANFPTPRILDVGTGSGAIAVALACKLPHAQLTATDLSELALAIARENAKRNGVTIRFLEGDLLAPVADERFEIVVSNPPYVPAPDRASVAVEVREYEPTLALFAGEDGLDVYRRLIPAAFDALVPGGFIALEFGYGQAPAVAELIAASSFFEIEFASDLQGIPRVACARHP